MTTKTTTQAPTFFLAPERNDHINTKTVLGNRIDMKVTSVKPINNGYDITGYEVRGLIICGGKVTRERCSARITSSRDWRSATA